MRSKLKVARPPHHPEDVISLVEQELGEVAPVLAGDSRNQRSWHNLLPVSRCPLDAAVCPRDEYSPPARGMLYSPYRVWTAYQT